MSRRPSATTFPGRPARPQFDLAGILIWPLGERKKGCGWVSGCWVFVVFTWGSVGFWKRFRFEVIRSLTQIGQCGL